MNVHVKIFPIYGLADTSREFDLQVQQSASLKELLQMVQSAFGKKVPDKGIMVIHNGKVADLTNTDGIFVLPDDWIWIMPVISGG